MAETILVAGASGILGRLVAAELHRRGYRVRALVRSASRAVIVQPHVDQIVIADALRPETLGDALHGAGSVFSCLGQSVALDLRNRAPGYEAVDYTANHNLLVAAQRAGVERFVYVSVCGAARYEQLAYMRAHEAVARELRASTMQYGIVMPTGFFAALLPLLDFARRGVGLVIGDGSARSNPIHEADLALVCADLVGESGMHEIEAGGPQVLTRREMTELAFAALQRPPRLMHAPPWLPRFYAFMARPFAPRLSELMAFAGAMFTSDGVATPRGSRTLGDYFSAAAGHTAG